jgi:Pentapeptide repeats (8 copies)
VLRRRYENARAAWTFGALVVVLLVAIALVAWDSVWPSWTGLRGKTLWDLADLVIVPISLALIAYLLSDAQRREERAIAETNRAADRQIAQAREEQAALQAYLSAMTDLLVAKNLDDATRRSVARSRTLTVLSGLHGAGKRDVMRFLKEAGMIDKASPLVELRGADLTGAELQSMDLSDTPLGGCNLAGSSLRGSSLRQAVLDGCDLTGVDMTSADLFGASVGAVALDDGTRFDDAILVSTDFSRAYFARPSVRQDIGERNRREADGAWIEALSAATWKGARFSYSTKWPAGFSAAQSGAIDISD